MVANKNKMPSRGIILFAHNNQEIDYGQLALVNALMIKRNMKENHITLITDEGTLKWLKDSKTEELVNYAFDNVIIQSWQVLTKQNTRRYRDTRSTLKSLPYHNYDRVDVYDLTPYEETLVLDSDYLVMSDSLDLVWGSKHNFMINSDVVPLVRGQEILKEEERWDPVGLKQVWATAFYFRKSEETNVLFNLVKFIRDNYDYYRHAYKYKTTMFRNDFAFSVACHVLNGFSETGMVKPLPVSYILTSLDLDEVIDVPNANSLVTLVEKPGCMGDFMISRIDDVNVHIMNKFSVIRLADKFVDLYKPGEQNA